MITAAIKTRKSGQVELLAPAGNIEAGYAALHYGADAVYLGLPCFSARASAANFSISELADITGYAHSLKKRRKIYAAVNTLILQNELDGLIDLLVAIADIGVDAVIVQDMGVLNILRRYFPRLKAHASTQMAIHNLYGVEAAQKMGITRVTLARELTFEEIAGIAAQSEIETEVFIHGALCYSYSGLCLFSSHLYGRSGNRGKCAYPCREWFRPELSGGGDNNGRDGVSPSGSRERRCRNADHYEKSPRSSGSGPNLIGKDGGFIFSMKDLALPNYITELRRIGVTALKIEGRMKSPLYVAAAVNYYRHLIDDRLSPDKERELASDVKTIFSRPWTDLYLKTRLPRDVIDPATQGHRGSPAGKVEEIAKNPGGHCLRFKTDLPIELHDGLQIDIAGLPRPFGFAVKNINIIGGGRFSEKKRVFTAPAGARVEIQLPRGHPVIPLGVVIYSSSSQKVKQQYDFFKPKPGQFRFRHSADFDIHVDAKRFDVKATVNVFPGIKGMPAGLEVKKHFEGLFQPAKNIDRVDEAILKAFSKLGDTNLKLGKLAVNNPHNLFVPISLLNSIRRDISAELEREIAGMPGKYAEVIKIALNAILSGDSYAKPACPSGKDKQGNFNWSLKTDQPHILSAFGPDDWRAIDEVIIECCPDNSPVFFDQLDRLSGAAGKSHLRLALPVIMRQWETEFFARTISGLISKGWEKWQIANLGGWTLLNNINKSGAKLDISSDWQVYALNRAAVLQLRTMGISKFTLSPEDSFENMRALLGEFSSGAVVIVYQDTPLMISETCLFASKKCSYPNTCGALWIKVHDASISGGTRRSPDAKSGRKPGNFREMIFDSSHDDKIRVISRNCRSIVLNRQPFCLATHLDELAGAGAINFRVDFLCREYSDKEALDIWRRLRSGGQIPFGYNANFNRGLA